MSNRWILLCYTLPRDPSAPRVALWRKLKKVGAVLLHDAIWVLPATPALHEHVRWLASEIPEVGGSVHVWQAQADSPEQEATLITQYVEQAEVGYQELLRLLDNPRTSRAELARRYRQIHAIDYFHAPSGDQVRTRLEGGEP
jgi:hypothetical protein